MLNEKYPFVLKPLEYPYDALEPYIDEETVYIHHDKHLKSYVDNLNTIISGYIEYQGWTLGELIKKNYILPKEIQNLVRNNAGGIYNHNFYFDIMKLASKPDNSEVFEATITLNFGSFDNFYRDFRKSALSRFGSGWTWLTTDSKGALYIISTPYQDTTFHMGLYPILLIDVWEHSYYLKYQNRRNDYLDAWFNLIDWEKVKENYEKTLAEICEQNFMCY